MRRYLLASRVSLQIYRHLAAALWESTRTRVIRLREFSERRARGRRCSDTCEMIIEAGDINICGSEHARA